jgi:hypothetical protein
LPIERAITLIYKDFRFIFVDRDDEVARSNPATPTRKIKDLAFPIDFSAPTGPFLLCGIVVRHRGIAKQAGRLAPPTPKG